MIYKFKSKATGDLIMLGANGDEMLRIIGKEPAAKGIIEVADMPAAMAALQAAVLAEEPAGDDAGDETAPQGGVTLRQRVWPVVEMMKVAHAAGQPIVWGV